ncbi:MAG: OmpA family protein [Ignavibacteria bacterium]|nr:OmpA family protein [Ignavibacteria bacterium]
MTRKFLAIVTVSLLFFSVRGFSADTTMTGVEETLVPPARIGIFGALGFNFSSPSVLVWQKTTPAAPLLTRYANNTLRYAEGNTHTVFVGGLLVGIPINRMFHFTGRLGINTISSSSNQRQPVGVDSVLYHAWNASSTLLEVSPGIEVYDLFGSVPVYLLGGLEFGFGLGSSVAQTTELRVAEQGVATENTAGSTEIINSNIRTALMLGAGYTFKLGDKWWLQPEISYRLPLSNVSSDVNNTPWKVGQLRVGINISFGIVTAAPPPTADRPKFGTRIDRITARNTDGNQYAVRNVAVEDLQYNEMFPLLPYVFCTEGSASPDASLQAEPAAQKEQGEFLAESLPQDAIVVNKNMLNIVGSRMRKYPNATLTITGTTDGKQESKNKALGEQRAMWAKQYLVNGFGISEDRIVTRTTATPAKPSSSTTPDGIAENRRIELSSNVPDVLAPVVIAADNQRIATPDVMQFHPVYDNADSIESWSLNISQAGRTLREVKANGKADAISWVVRPNELSASQVPIDYEFTAVSGDGDSATSFGSLPVEYISSVRKKTENLPDKTIDKYSLVLFDFDKSDLTPENSRILEQMVLPSIKSNSKVSIIGYTDRIGSDEYNKKLSMDRAETVKNTLMAKAKDAKYTALGVGESTEIFNNDAPIGRQLSRTVQVIIETPRSK